MFTAIANGIVWIMALVMIVAGITNILKPKNEFGQQFMEAFNIVGNLFVCSAGMMAAVPYVEKLSVWAFSGLFDAIGADVSIAPCLFIAADNGAYQLAYALADSPGDWMFANVVAYLAGPIVCYIIPVSFSIIPAKDKKYCALGLMCGLISIPFGLFVTMLMLKVGDTLIRPEVSATAAATQPLNLEMSEILHNMVPLTVFCVVLALCLYFLTDITVKVMTAVGNAITVIARIIFVFAVFEYFTGFFAKTIGWGFAPILADEENMLRALEIVGGVGMMLAGAYPLVWLIRRYCSRPLERLGSHIGISAIGITSFLTSACDSIITFGMFKNIHPIDKVKSVAFSVCGAWILGAHISFTVNTQPTILVPLMIGKIVGACIALIVAQIIAVPVAKKYMQEDIEKGIIAPDEYMTREQLPPAELKRMVAEGKSIE